MPNKHLRFFDSYKGKQNYKVWHTVLGQSCLESYYRKLLSMKPQNINDKND